ncbi:MAG: tetratricopeptide repeat protein [Streptosporangiaceae bacterium]
MAVAPPRLAPRRRDCSVLRLFRDLDAPRAEAYVLKNLGAVYTASGNYQAAAADLQRALQLLRDLGCASRRGRGAQQPGRPADPLRVQPRSLRSLRPGTGYRPGASRAFGGGTREGIGNSHLHDASFGEAAAALRQALAICQSIGSPRSRRVRMILLHTSPRPMPAADSS